MWMTTMRAGMMYEMQMAAWGIFWGAHGLRVSCRVWGHHVREPQGKDARGMDIARPAGPRGCSRRLLFPCGLGPC